ncbi:cytochrome b/b6 domain-containing protein [Pseudomonas sp. RP23018S]|uniref:cytochrome b n=1 Tax=Pseudomonas sp. RP23018S TaxID=3096037 RepID=UPI002ACA12B3|nr:cytochrome b/b6 domain-containing protein [Pseudomonas sp. RP23018S]MDZ5603980.1 cytochrome b/b6 domain-containing protein [Pseudomonas sp. RP23018S]
MSEHCKVDRYGWEQVLLHWASALVIIWVLISGFYVAYAEVEAPTRAWVGWVNVSLSTVYIPVFVLRCLVRVLKPAPASIDRRALGHLAACIAHQALYWLTALVLLSGVLMMERAIDVFGWWQIPAPLADVTWQGRWFTLHIASCVGLAVVVLVHVAAVCVHQLSGQRILRRMWL